MACASNILVILLLALEQPIQSADTDPCVKEMIDTSLWAIKYLGHDMGIYCMSLCSGISTTRVIWACKIEHVSQMEIRCSDLELPLRTLMKWGAHEY